MKKVVLYLLCFVVLMGGLTSCKKETLNTKYNAVKNISSLPKDYTKSIINNDLLLNGIKVSNGYFYGKTDKGNFVQFYDLNGTLVWEKEYNFGNPDETYYFNIVPLNDGGFILSANSSTHQLSDGSWVYTNPIITKCDKAGDIEWMYEYKGFSDTALQNVFVLSNGDVITIGYTESTETKTTGVVSPSKIYLSKLTSEGKLVTEKYYGGSDYDSLFHAEYIEGKGIVATINSQSTDGTFSASKDGYGVSVVALFDESLKLSWYEKFDEYLTDDSVSVYKDNIYILSGVNFGDKYHLSQYDLNDNFIKKVLLSDKGLHMISGCNNGILLQSDTALNVYDENLNIKSKIPFDAGTVEKMIECKDYFLVLSTNITGTLPQPPYISSIWFSTELVYSGYDDKGRLLWREAYDSTPEAFKHPQEDWITIDPSVIG